MPALRTRYVVAVESTDNAERDAQLARFKDERQTIDDVQRVCLEYGVRARLLDPETGERLEMTADGAWEPATGEWRAEPDGHPPAP